MRPSLLIFAIAAFLLPPQVARAACWKAPTAACFEAQAREMALAYHAEGPALDRLHDLIVWEALPPGPAAARTLLEGLTYDALVAYHAADTPDAPDDESFERALLLLMGLVDPGIIEPVPGDDLLAIYALALQSEDQGLAARWYAHLPPYLAATSGLPAPDGAERPAVDPFAEAQAQVVAALTHLRAGALDAALRLAADLSGEAGFLTWRALARHAIEAGDMTLLARAVTGMQTALTPPEAVPFNEKAFALALEAAEKEFARTGDPDAMAHVYEMFDTHAATLPVGAALTVALARRYLKRQTGQTGQTGGDGFDAALLEMARALSTGEDEDDASPMLNARTALRLGLEAEADALIDMVFANYPGVPGLFVDDLPDEPTPWANAWLDRMIARFDATAANPSAFEQRAYWSLWPDQDALSAAIDITGRLALYDRRDEAYDFAKRAAHHLAGMSQHQVRLFEGETAGFLYPPDVALPRMRALGMEAMQIAYAMKDAGRPRIALLALMGQPVPRNLGYWMRLAPDLPGWVREDYIATLIPLIADEAARLAAAGYPALVQALHVDAAQFHAALGDMQAARSHYEQLGEARDPSGTRSATHSRLKALGGIAQVLSPATAPVSYPDEDFAL